MFKQTCLKRPYKANKNIKMSSFKSSEHIQKKEGGPDRSVSDNQSSSVTLYKLAMKAIKYCNFQFRRSIYGFSGMWLLIAE